jgi:hypothetical protein
MAVMKPWIAKKVIELLGFEDDVLIEYIHLHEGGRFRFEKPGQEDLHVFGVDDLCVRVHLVSERWPS